MEAKNPTEHYREHMAPNASPEEAPVRPATAGQEVRPSSSARECRLDPSLESGPPPNDSGKRPTEPQMDISCSPLLRRRDVLTFSSGEAFQPFAYSVGQEGSRFFAELRDHRRFLGLKCPSCHKVYIPPRPLCGPCYQTMDEWVEVGPEGTLEAFTVLRFAFVDPETGQKKPVPYGYGFIRLDGADTNLQHFLKIEEARPLKIGMRLRPVFEEARHGNLRDIRYFEKISLPPKGEDGDIRQTNLYFEDFVPGQIFNSPFSREITAKTIEQFAELSGDKNGLHVDDAYAARSPFKQRIGHGLLGLSMATGLLHEMGILRETVIAFAAIDWRFKGPILVGDKLAIELKVQRKKSVGKQGLVTFQVKIFNQNKKIIQEGTWSGWVRTRVAIGS